MDATPGNLDDQRIERRRAAIRRALLEELRAHHGRRRTRRRVLSATLLLIAAGVAIAIGSSNLRQAEEPVGMTARNPVEPAPRGPGAETPPTGVDIRIVTTRSAVTERYVITPPAMVEWIDDRALLADLASLDRPTGLIRRGDRAWLTSEVTDPVRPGDR